MQYFQRSCRIALAILGLTGAVQAFAVGTDAGTSIVNSVTLDYSVNGGAQPQLSNAVTFVVDRALAVDVTAADTDWVSVTVGQQYATLTGVPAANYAVTNNSNDAADLVLALVDQDNTQVTGFASSAAGGSFDEVSFVVAVDTNANQAYDDGVDTVLTPDGNGVYSIAGVAEDAVVNLVVAVAVPGTAAADDFATYTLVAAVATGAAAIAADDSGNASPGQVGSNNPNTLAGEEMVFQDGDSANAEDVTYDFFGFVVVAAADSSFNGQNSDSSGFVVRGVDLLVAKHVEVLYDPISGNRYDGAGNATAAQPKAIPGAVILYVVGVRNRDAFLAQALQITDDLPDGAASGATEPVDEGNPGAAAVNVPASVTFDIDPGAGVENATFSLAAVTDLDQIHREDCAGVPIDLGYAAGTQAGPDTTNTVVEVDVAFGDCAATEDGFLAYFVTVETSN